MCGRYSIYDIAELEAKYGNLQDFKSSYNAAPKMKLPIITSDGVEIMQWGFDLGKFFMINTRLESLSEKFKWMKKEPCLVAANSFFEWKHVGSKKIPYSISVKGKQLVYFAGVIHDNAYSIITTTSCDEMKKIHDRMPVITNEKWLSGDVCLLKTYSGKLDIFQVSNEVNNVRNNRKEIIKKIKTLESF